MPLGDSAFPTFCIAFTIVAFWESIEFALVFKRFSQVPRLRSQLWIVFASASVPIPVLSLQIPDPHFEVSSSWFPVPASVQVGSQPKQGKAKGAGPWRKHLPGRSVWAPYAAPLAARFPIKYSRNDWLYKKYFTTAGSRK